MSRLRGHSEALALPLLVLVAMLAFTPVFADLRYWAWAAGAVLAATLLCSFVFARGWSLSLSGLLSVAGLAAYSVLVIAVAPTSEPTRAFTGQLVDGVGGAWANLLTVELPADPDGGLVMVPVLIGWLATFAAVELALRSDFGALPLVPVLAAYVGATLFSVPDPPALWLAGVFLALCFLWLFVRSNRTSAEVVGASSSITATALDESEGLDLDGRKRFSLVGRLAFAIPVVVIAVFVAGGLADLLPVGDTDDGYDPREQIDRDFALDNGLSPLVLMKAQLIDETPDELFTVQVAGIPDDGTVDRIRVAALEQYDGALWTTDARFAQAGTEQPRDGSVVVPTVDVTQRYEVRGLEGPLLPTIGQPVRVEAESFGIDRSTGQVATEQDDLEGSRYRVVGQLPLVTEDAARSAAARTAPDAAVFTALPEGLPEEISETASAMTGGAEGLDALEAIEAALFGEGYGYSTDVPPGHSYGILQEFLAEGLPVGFSEQFASGFAVLARLTGFPTRVAVGYLVDPEALASGEEVVVTNADAHAWPEVLLDGLGWVPFEPTDRSDPVPDPDQSELPGGAAPEEPLEAPPLVVQPDFVGEETDRSSDEADDGGLPWWVLVALLVVLVPVLVLGGIVGWKRRRRQRRRRRGTPSTRLLGAWREVLDRLVERDLVADRSLTAFEVTHANADDLPPEALESLVELAPLVDVAVFDQAEPTEELIDEAWAIEARFEAGLRGSESVRRRLVCTFSPKPLRSDRRRRGRRVRPVAAPPVPMAPEPTPDETPTDATPSAEEVAV